MQYIAVVYGFILSIALWGACEFWAENHKLTSTLVVVVSCVSALAACEELGHASWVAISLATAVVLLLMAWWVHREADRWEQGHRVSWMTRQFFLS